jgi:S1-C subfamily serine protease
LDGAGKPLWVPNPKAEIDVAVIPIDFGVLEEHGMQASYFESDRHVALVEKLKEIGLTEGDFVYALGFPMGIVGGESSAVIVRGGTIARIRDALVRANTEFLVDAFVFPGNSGGPVVSKPEAMSIKGTKAQKAGYLIGVVRSYVPYADVAVSQQTQKPRVVFEENSGLAAVHPIDFVVEAVMQDFKALHSAQPEGEGALPATGQPL